MWELRSLEVDENRNEISAKDKDAADQDYEQFLQELEGDREMRAGINLYKANRKSAAAGGKASRGTDGMDLAVSTSEEDAVPGDLDEEQVRMDELLDELALSSISASSSAAVGADDTRVVLTPEEAAKAAALNIGSTGFDPSDFDATKFNFL